MRKRFNKAIATLTLMMMILTLVMPVGAFAAPPADNPDYTFTESEANDGSFTEQFHRAWEKQRFFKQIHEV